MPLELRRKPDGTLKSKYWYGAYMVNGKRHATGLGVKVKGTPPASLREKSDDEDFEASREAAQQALDKLISDAREKRQPEEYVQKLHEIRTGRRIDSIPLSDLASAWDKAPRKRKGSPRYVAQAHKVFERFVKFVQEHESAVETLADVQPETAEAFMESERERGVSGRTFNSILILLRSSVKALSQRAHIVRNPFAGIPTREEETVHRKPFTQVELERILKAAEDDPFIRPVIVAGICTAMRRGDCCLLRWSEVDTKEGFVRVKTSKTGETVEIPMFSLLREEIERHSGNGSEFVFPEQARMYQKNAQGVTYRVRKTLEAAGFFDQEEEAGDADDVKESPAPLPLPAAEVLDRGLAAIGQASEADMSAVKRDRMIEAFRAYVGGMGLPTIARKMGISKSSVSLYLHEIEKRAGIRVLRATGKRRPAKSLGEVSVAGKVGLQRRSVRDFHSFRVTWITVALAAGVPLELVQRVTGHKTTQVVLKHYFRPGREDFRKAIEGAMPKLLTAGGDGAGGADEYEAPGTPAAMIRAAIVCLQKQTGRNWKAKRDEALRTLRGAAEWVEGRILHEKPAALASK